MAEPSIETVWFDFGGVLTPPVAEAARSVAREAQVPWKTLWRAIDHVAREMGTTGLQPLELGALSQEEWARRVDEVLPVRPAIDLGRWDEYWYRDRPPVEAILREIRKLRDGGVRVGMLTNSVREWEPHRRRMLSRYEDVFDAVVRSHELGIAKPDPRIFAEAESRLPSRGRALLIDDVAVNCAAARAFGWKAHHHREVEATVTLVQRLTAAARTKP